MLANDHMGIISFLQKLLKPSSRVLDYSILPWPLHASHTYDTGTAYVSKSTIFPQCPCNAQVAAKSAAGAVEGTVAQEAYGIRSETGPLKSNMPFDPGAACDACATEGHACRCIAMCHKGACMQMHSHHPCLAILRHLLQ